MFHGLIRYTDRMSGIGSATIYIGFCIASGKQIKETGESSSASVKNGQLVTSPQSYEPPVQHGTHGVGVEKYLLFFAQNKGSDVQYLMQMKKYLDEG
jgi:hypothetical protein